METESLVVHLDTHIVLDLVEGRVEQIPDRAKHFISDATLFVSPMVQLELEYLFETKRIQWNSDRILRELQSILHLQISDRSFGKIVAQAVDEKWTRDPFDRIIVAQARFERVPLLTRDKNILENYSRAFWA